MSVLNVTITNTYALVNAGAVTCTVKKAGGGALLFNSLNVDDTTAIPAYKNEGAVQFVQTAAVNTYVRHNGPAGENWEIIVDDNV